MSNRSKKTQQIVEMMDAIEEVQAHSFEAPEVIEVAPVEVDAAGRKKHVTIAHEELEAKGLKNKSQVIRYLDGEGFSRSAIAGFLNVRYQHVRNVLITPLKRT